MHSIYTRFKLNEIHTYGKESTAPVSVTAIYRQNDKRRCENRASEKGLGHCSEKIDQLKRSASEIGSKSINQWGLFIQTWAWPSQKLAIQFTFPSC